MTTLSGFHIITGQPWVANKKMVSGPNHRPLPPPGNGYLAGEFPGGITTVDAVPVSATVRVLYRPASWAQGDGLLIAQVQSAHDGTWRVDGLNPALRYDVVGRKDGYNDVIVAGVKPSPY